MQLDGPMSRGSGICGRVMCGPRRKRGRRALRPAGDPHLQAWRRRRARQSPLL